MPLNVSITTEQKIKITLSPVTQSGQPATLDGEPVWEVQSGSGTVEPEAGGLSAYIISGNDIGDTVVKVSADADLGQGVRTIEDLITATVTNAEAAALGLSAGTPESK